VTGRFPRLREVAASAAQYLLLGGFASVAAGISAQGLTGFARANMGLTGPWPYLLFFSLDGAASVCAVLLMRRAARAESGLAPRLAVWGLVAASAAFNATHSPRRPAAPEAFALMPVIAATLFEFTLRELRLRTEGRADRRLTALRWLHPVERIRVQLLLSAEGGLSAEDATRRIRIQQAARCVYLLRLALHAHKESARTRTVTAWRARRAEHRAQKALTRAGFAEDQDIASDILRQVQVLTITPELARLDYTTAAGAHRAVSNLITRTVTASPLPDLRPVPPATSAQGRGPVIPDPVGRLNGSSARPGVRLRTDLGQRALTWPQPESVLTPGSQALAGNATHPAGGGDRDGQLIAAATRIIAEVEAEANGRRLSQTALAERLRSEGFSIANDRLRWLSSACGLERRHD
jgi:hypothetical protein